LRLERFGHDRIEAVSYAQFRPFFLDEFLAVLRQLHDFRADLPALGLAFLDLLFPFGGRKVAKLFGQLFGFWDCACFERRWETALRRFENSMANWPL
jgi:hypothetical protein